MAAPARAAWRASRLSQHDAGRVARLIPSFGPRRLVAEPRGRRCGALMAGAGPAGRGAFIVFEGCDRCGKTTQSKKLVAALRENGVLAEWCSFPDRSTGVGQLIDSYLAGAQNSEDDVIHLLFAANRLEKRQELIVKLQGGTTLVCDRYAYSGAAFTLAKGSPGLDLAWCKSVERGLLPAPDVVFFLKAPADVAAGRGGFGNERYEVLEFQKKVADWYMRLSKTEGWTELDATKSIDAVHEEILKATAQAVDACKSGRPLGLLWQEGEVQSLKSSRNEAEIGGKEDK